MKLSEVAKKEEPEFTGALAKYDKWYSTHDLWHPGFPQRFCMCVESYLPDVDEESLEAVAEWMADNLTSCYADKVKYFIEYAKANPIPSGLSYYDNEADINTYCEAAMDAIQKMYQRDYPIEGKSETPE